MARKSNFARMFRVLEMLRSNRYGLHIKRIAEAVEVTDRTIRRDLQTLQSEGCFPIYSEETPRGTVWKMDESARNSMMVPISEEEALALILAQKVLENRAGDSTLSESLKSVLQKLESQRDKSFKRHLSTIEESIVSSPFDAKIPDAIFPTCPEVMKAIETKRQLRFDYEDWNGNVTGGRMVAPLAYVISQKRPYLVAHCYLRGELRKFVPERISNLEVTDRIVQEEFEFDSKEYANHSMGGHDAEPEDVLLWIAPWIARHFTENYNLPEQNIYESDGKVLMEFRIGLNWTLIWWLSQFGPNVEVMEPVHLREWIAGFLSEASEQYIEG